MLAGGTIAASTGQDVGEGDVDNSSGSTVHNLRGALRGEGRSNGVSGSASRARRASARGRANTVDLALGGAGSIDGVESTEIAIFTTIQNTVTTSGFDAVGSAFVGNIGVVITLIALLSSFDDAVTADSSRSGSPGNISLVDGLNSSRVSVTKESSSEFGELSGSHSAGPGEDVPFDVFRARRNSERTGVSGNRGSSVEGVGKAEGRSVADTAGVGLASHRATSQLEVVVGVVGDETVITKLTVEIILNAITTIRKPAVGSASIGSVSIVGSIITFLAVINDTITTDGIGTAEVSRSDFVTEGSARVGKN